MYVYIYICYFLLIQNIAYCTYCFAFLYFSPQQYVLEVIPYQDYSIHVSS